MEPPFDIQKRTFLFAVAVVRFCRGCGDIHPVSRRLSWQLLDAATSVGANMEEADAAQSSRDFVHKVGVARKESKEALFWLRLLYATDPMIREALQGLLDESRQLAKIVTTIKRNAESNQRRQKGNGRVPKQRTTPRQEREGD
jgi:four helix bundle protein